MLDLEDVFDFPAAEADYLINYSPKHSLVYLEVPKAGCTTIKRTLQSLELGAGSPAPARPHDKTLSPLLSPSASKMSVRSLLISEGLFRFCFVRNPYTRSLSAYLDKMVTTQAERERLAPSLGLNPEIAPTFAQFLMAVLRQGDFRRDIHWRTQSALLRPDLVRYDFIGRFEHLQSQLPGVLFLVTGESQDIEHTAEHSTGAADRLDEFLGPDEETLIRAIYREDFRNFAYSPHPRLSAL